MTEAMLEADQASRAIQHTAKRIDLLATFVINRPGVAPGLSIACATVPFQLVIASVVNGLGSIHRVAEPAGLA